MLEKLQMRRRKKKEHEKKKKTFLGGIGSIKEHSVKIL